MKQKKNNLRLTALLLVTGMISVDCVYASDDNYSFDANLYAFHGNSYTKEHYRQTTSPNNPWKVNLAYSKEGVGTYATFWLDSDQKGGRVSGYYNVKQGTGANYLPAYSFVNQSNCGLGMENNNYTNGVYPINGYWDEETW